MEKFKLVSKDEQIQKTFETFKEALEFIKEGAVKEFSLFEGNFPPNKWIVGEAIYNGTRSKTYALLRSDDGATKVLNAENFDIIYNPYLQKGVYNKSHHEKMIGSSEMCGRTGSKSIYKQYPLLQLLMECAAYHHDILRYGNEKIIIGQKQEGYILLHGNRKFYPNTELIVSGARVEYEAVSWVFDASDFLRI